MNKAVQVNFKHSFMSFLLQCFANLLKLENTGAFQKYSFIMKFGKRKIFNEIGSGIIKGFLDSKFFFLPADSLPYTNKPVNLFLESNAATSP